MSEVVVFRFETCPNCDRLEELLRELGIEFRVMGSSDELRKRRVVCKGCFGRRLDRYQ